MQSFFDKIKDIAYRSIIEQNRYQFIISGLGRTLIIAFFAVILGVILGSLISIVINYNKEEKKLKLLSGVFKLYVTIIRGTPVVLQLMIIYYLIFKSVNINVILVGVLAFGLNSAAYVSEIIRAGIESVEKGQKEAAYALGLSYTQTMLKIVFPQAIKNILPALGNEFITLLKETSVAGYIGIMELVKASDIIASVTYDYFFPLIIVAIIYLVLTLGLSGLLRTFEKKVLNRA